MRTFLFLFFILFLTLQLEANDQVLPQENLCPKQMIVTIECAENNNEFQLLKHAGRYTEPKMELNENSSHMICTYSAHEWISRYKVVDDSGSRIVSVTNLQELGSVAHHVRSKGFQFGSDVSPFSMITYKSLDNNFTADQMFLYSGLESTFGKNNVTVAAINNTNITTAVLSDKYMKSENAAADSYVTGSNCFIQIKND